DKMESDRSNSQDRVAHASDLSTVLVRPGQALRPVSSSGGSGCASTTTEGPRGTEARLHHNTRKLCQLFHRRLLRADGERPCGRRSPEKRYELAARQVEHAASSPGATAIIRLPPAVLAQSVCRTSSLPMEVSTVFGADSTV